MTLVIREAGPADEPAVEALWVEAWTVAMPTIDFGARLPWFSTHLRSLRTGGALLLVATNQDVISGFVTVDPREGVLDQLAVRPSCQGHGVGHALLDAAKRHAPHKLHLSVNTANRRAIAFYERAGFVTVGSGHNTRSGLPVLHMTWTDDRL